MAPLRLVVPSAWVLLASVASVISAEAGVPSGLTRHRWGVARARDGVGPAMSSAAAGGVASTGTDTTSGKLRVSTGTDTLDQPRPPPPPPPPMGSSPLLPVIGPSREPTYMKTCEAAADLDCSAGCIAVVGNGFRISRGQAAVAENCQEIYRANYMDSASECFMGTTHCFFYTLPAGFVAVRRRAGTHSSPMGNARKYNIRCSHAVFLNGNLEEKNMTWQGTSETFTSDMLRETLSQHWDPKEKLGKWLPKDPFKKPSSGLFMIGHAVRNMGRKCVHIIGFNFHFKEELGAYKREHPFTAERRLVQNLIRERQRVFFHPLVETRQAHMKGQLVYGV